MKQMIFISNYQQFPDQLASGLILSRLRELASFAKHFPSAFVFRWKNRDNLNLLKSQKGLFTDRDFLLIGNGPSSKNLTSEQVDIFQRSGGHVAVVNDFFRSALSYQVSPNYYFLADPAYWKIRSTQDSEKTSNLIDGVDEKSNAELDYFFDQNKEITIIQPLRQPKIRQKHDRYLFTDSYNVQGIGNFGNPVLAWSYPHSVALVAIAVAKYMGYRRIYFSGLDFSHFLYFVVDDLNTILFNPSGAHFYDQKGNSNRKQSLTLDGLPIRNYGDVHFAAAIHRRDFLRLTNENCINVGLDLTNDVCYRACLIKYN